MNGKQASYDYGKCGEVMAERRVGQEFRIKGQLIVIEDVPTGICPRCGEKIVNAEVGRQLAALIADSAGLRPARKLIVPVISFAPAAA